MVKALVHTVLFEITEKSGQVNCEKKSATLAGTGRFTRWSGGISFKPGATTPNNWLNPIAAATTASCPGTIPKTGATCGPAYPRR